MVVRSSVIHKQFNQLCVEVHKTIRIHIGSCSWAIHLKIIIGTVNEIFQLCQPQTQQFHNVQSTLLWPRGMCGAIPHIGKPHCILNSTLPWNSYSGRHGGKPLI